MAFSNLDLQRAQAALSPLVGHLLQGVFQPQPDRLILSLWRPGDRRILLLVYRGDHTRIHTIEARPPNPRDGSSFQQLLRKRLQGPLTALEQVLDDRIIDLSFGDLTLRAELSGRHGNLFLLDTAGTIIASALHSHSKRRRLTPGSPYVPILGGPPSGPRKAPLFADLDGEALLDAFAAHYAKAEAESEFTTLQRELLTRSRRQLKKVTRRLAALEKDIERAAGADIQRRHADLIQIHLHTLKRGLSTLRVPDIFQSPPSPIDIPLDPALSPQENMSRLYHSARRYEAAEERILERAEAAENEERALRGLIASIEEATSLQGLQALKPLAPASRSPQRANNAKGAPPRLPYKRYIRQSSGQEIRVGRGAKDNDALTFRHSKGNDLWLHIRGAPGAHVTVPKPGPSPSLDLLLDAAALALKYGGRQVGDDGEVSYTRVKYVKRAPGGPPGRVTHSQDKTLYLRLTEEALAGLKRED